ncbi:MAG: hypothetical protein J6A54_06965 [Clostridia bacterium]|nr:hypothetical protein [Clostridia bacterium]
MKTTKNIMLLASPLLLFFVCFIPYGRINSHFLVDWLGCGCVQGFNANDFTRIFWLFIAAWATISSIFLSKILPKEKIALKIYYVIGMLVVSLATAYAFSRLMMWC